MKVDQAAKEADMAAGTTSEEGSHFSSSGTEDSEEDVPVGTEPDSSGDVWMEMLVDIKSCISTMDATHNAIVSQLASLEKVVMTVREDMTWVRNDVRVVHEVVEKMAEYVSMLNNTVAEVEGVPIHRSPEVAPWCKWQGAARAEEQGLADPPGIAEDDRVDLRDEEPSHIHVPRSAESAVWETQMFDMDTNADGNRKSTAVEGGREGWRQNLEVAFGLSPGTRKQAGRRDEDDAQETAYQQMEISVDETQTETQAPGPSMWSASMSAASSMRAPVFGGGESSEGWISSKRVRGSWSDVSARNTAEKQAEELSAQPSLNLNASPENLEGVEGMTARGGNAVTTDTGTASRGGGRGTGRGVGRVKGPPLVQPRYRSTASILSVSSYIYLCFIFMQSGSGHVGTVMAVAELCKLTPFPMVDAGFCKSWRTCLGAPSGSWKQTGGRRNCW